MIKDPTQHNIETAPGIIDIYDDEITSFTMSAPDTCNVKQRIDGLIATEFDIEV